MAVGYNALVAHSDKDKREELQNFILTNITDCNVFFAADGPQVIRSLDQMRINFLFMEMELPKKDGEGVILEILRLAIDKRPSLIFLYSPEDYSNLDSKTKKMTTTYIPDMAVFEVVNQQIQNFLNPKAANSSKTSTPSGKKCRLMLRL